MNVFSKKLCSNAVRFFEGLYFSIKKKNKELIEED